MSKDLRTAENETLNNIIRMAAEAMQLKAGSIDRRVITEEIADSALCIRYQFKGKEVEKIKQSTTCSKLYDCISQYQDHPKDDTLENSDEEMHKCIVKVHKAKQYAIDFDTLYHAQFNPCDFSANYYEKLDIQIHKMREIFKCSDLPFVKTYFSVEEVSKILNVNESTISCLIADGRLKTSSETSNGIKIGIVEIIMFAAKYPGYTESINEYFLNAVKAQKELRDCIRSCITLFGVTNTIKENYNNNDD